MSVSAPVPTPRPAPMSQPTTSQHPDLHSLAIDVVSDLQALAAGLHEAGAAPQAVQVVVNMTNAIHTVAQHLAQIPPMPNPAAAQQGGPEQGGGPSAAAGPAPQGQGPAGGGSAQTSPHKAMGNAIGNLLQAAHDAAHQGQ
jgi:hypothetical protein